MKTKGHKRGKIQQKIKNKTENNKTENYFEFLKTTRLPCENITKN